jgi:cell division protein FtsL
VEETARVRLGMAMPAGEQVVVVRAGRLVPKVAP